jgi:hypothetical protein
VTVGLKMRYVASGVKKTSGMPCFLNLRHWTGLNADTNGTVEVA